MHLLFLISTHITGYEEVDNTFKLVSIRYCTLFYIIRLFHAAFSYGQMPALSSFVSLFLLFGKVGEAWADGIAWLPGQGMPEPPGSSVDGLVSSHLMCHESAWVLGHFPGTHSGPDHWRLVCLPTLWSLSASSGLCQFCGLPSTNTSTH